ncbi:MAG: hypothetical protein ACFB50_02755 [Rubrobacteraceae bacterium]
MDTRDTKRSFGARSSPRAPREKYRFGLAVVEIRPAGSGEGREGLG